MRRPPIRFVLLAVLATLPASCGSSASNFKTYYGIKLQNLPQHRVYNMNWIEAQPNAMIVQVKQVVIGPHGWSAKVGFKNISKDLIILPTGGQKSPVDFGIGVFIDSLSPRIEDPGNYIVYVKKVRPIFPQVLKPGQTWNGTFTSPQPPRANRYIRLVFGVFFFSQPVPKGDPPYFLFVTTHGLHAPPPQGAAAAKAG